MKWTWIIIALILSITVLGTTRIIQNGLNMRQLLKLQTLEQMFQGSKVENNYIF